VRAIYGRTLGELEHGQEDVKTHLKIGPMDKNKF
jgi:hypothetical protein